MNVSFYYFIITDFSLTYSSVFPLFSSFMVSLKLNSFSPFLLPGKTNSAFGL